MSYQLVQCIRQLDHAPQSNLLSTLRLQLDFSEFAFLTAKDARRQELLRQYTAWVDVNGPPAGIHGCLDTCFDSPDDRIRATSLANAKASLSIAGELQASYCVFHAYVSSERPDESIERQVPVWQALCEDLPAALTLAIENVPEPHPETLLTLVERIDHPQVKLCLDTGHLNVNSSRRLEDWVRTFAPHLAYIHLHWNSGRADEHRAPGDPMLDRLFRALERVHCTPVIALEYDPSDLEREVARIRRHYPNT